MNKKLVSVIIPVYNVEQYLGRCVNSVLNQSYTNLEIILVDDGSKDSSGILCDKIAKEDNRIIVIHKKMKDCHLHEIKHWITVVESILHLLIVMMLFIAI